MIPLAAFDGWGSALISSIVGGLIAAIVAVALLQRTKADEAQKRREEREAEERGRLRHSAEALLRELRDLADLVCSSNIVTVRRASTYPLRNQIAVSVLESMNEELLTKLSRYVSYVRQFRDWVRSIDRADAFYDPQLSVRDQLAISQTAIRQYAEALEKDLARAVKKEAPAATYPDLPELPPVMP